MLYQLPFILAFVLNYQKHEHGINQGRTKEDLSFQGHWLNDPPNCSDNTAGCNQTDTEIYSFKNI